MEKQNIEEQIKNLKQEEQQLTQKLDEIRKLIAECGNTLKRNYTKGGAVKSPPTLEEIEKKREYARNYYNEHKDELTARKRMNYHKRIAEKVYLAKKNAAIGETQEPILQS